MEHRVYLSHICVVSIPWCDQCYFSCNCFSYCTSTCALVNMSTEWMELIEWFQF